MRSWFQHYWSQHTLFPTQRPSDPLLGYSEWHTTPIFSLSFCFASNGTIFQKNQASRPWRSNYQERFIPRCLENAQRDRATTPTHQSTLWCRAVSACDLRQSSGTITLKCWILSNISVLETQRVWWLYALFWMPFILFLLKKLSKLARKGDHRTMCKIFKLASEVCFLLLLQVRIKIWTHFHTTGGVPEPISKRDIGLRSQSADLWLMEASGTDPGNEVEAPGHAPLHQTIFCCPLLWLHKFLSQSRSAFQKLIERVSLPSADADLRAEFDGSVKRALEGQGRFVLFHTRIARGPAATVLWSARPEEHLIRTPLPSGKSAVVTLHEVLGLTKDEFTKLQPHILEFLDSQNAGKDVEVKAGCWWLLNRCQTVI